MSSHQTIAVLSSTWWMSIIITSAIIYLVLKWSMKTTISRQKTISIVAGCFLLFIAIFIHVYEVIRGDWNLQTSLPLNLCSISAILSGIVLIFPNQDLYEFLLFWGIPGAFHSFITPELTLGNQGWYFYDYYLAHGGIILSVFYLSFIFKFKPRPYSWLRVFGWTQVLILIVFLIDKAIGANYMYLVQKSLAHNVFVHGIWPWYIVGFELAGLIHFFIVYLIFRRSNRISNLDAFGKYGMKIAFAIISMGMLLPMMSAQTGLQNIRGEIMDKDSEHVLSYVSIALFSDTTVVQSVQSNDQGKFEFKAIVPGRYVLKTYSVGYKSSEIKDVIVNSGKETIVDIFLDEMPQQLNEVTIQANMRQEAVNEMILAGGKVFSVDETNRYAGSRGDPARMAASFAGTQSTDDSRNDIVIRGNSPLGILWRIQDVDIPNPNHFAIPGTTGGAISILNNKMFRNSDFLIGAFPAEYGNCNAGVFDIKLRNGNNARHEGTVQFGFLGTELALEGPLSSKQNSTYLITYRYSTLKLFEAFNVRIGTDAVPNYQDVSFKINVPMKHNDNLSFFGIGGSSKIDIILSKFDKPSDEIYGENNKDQYFKSSMGLVGVTYSKSINSSMLFKATLSHIINYAGENDFTIFRAQDYKVDSLVRTSGYRFNNNKSALALSLQNKINARNTIKAGIHIDLLYHDLLDSVYQPTTYTFLNRLNSTGYTSLWQGYAQWKFKWNTGIEMNSGIHVQYSSFNNQTVVEPRFSIQWQMNKLNAFSFGTGLHSQLQPYYIYYYKTVNPQGRVEEQNKELGFSKSFHSTLAYDLTLTNNLRLKLEAYYIRLFDIPVNSSISTSYSVINEGGEFGRFFPGKLENSGTGYNDGLEATLEKTFSSGYYLLFNASLFKSKYKGSDGVKRNTAYNANFTMNALMGKEIPVGRNHNKVISVGTKISYAGGRRYSPADLPASKQLGELVIQDAYRNDLQFKNYFRLDMKLGYKINTARLTHEFGIDLVNALGSENILALVYAPDPRNVNDNPIKQENQLGFLPLFYYKLDFTMKRH